MNLGLDLDGVFADFNTALVNLLFKQTGIRLPAPGPNYPVVWNYPKVDGKLTPEQDRNLWDTVKNTDFWGELEAYEGTRETLEQLNALDRPGNNIYFITSRPGAKAKQLTEQWLLKQGFHSPRVIIADQKGPEARALSLNFFVDDKPENCQDVYADSRASTYLVDRPYNQWFDEALDDSKGGILRVPSAQFALNHFLEGMSLRVAA